MKGKRGEMKTSRQGKGGVQGASEFSCHLYWADDSFVLSSMGSRRGPDRDKRKKKSVNDGRYLGRGRGRVGDKVRILELSSPSSQYSNRIISTHKWS